MLVEKTKIADITFFEQNMPNLSRIWAKKNDTFFSDKIVFLPLNMVRKRKNNFITIFFITPDKISFAFIRFSANKYMEIKFQEFRTFGICEKLSKNGRFSRYNLSKFVIFEKCLVHWIMLHYMVYLNFLVKIAI